MGDGFPLATKNGFSWPPWIHLVIVNVAQHLKLSKKLHVSLQCTIKGVIYGKLTSLVLHLNVVVLCCIHKWR